MAYEEISRYTIRAEFKKHHFECGPEQLNLLYKIYQASNMLLRNAKDEDYRDRDTREFLEMYKNEIINRIKQDSRRIPTVEFKNCRDLIQMEYMQKSKAFQSKFSELENILLRKVNECQQHIKRHGLSSYVSYNLLTEAQCCFVLCRHPEMIDTVKYMRKDRKITDIMQMAIRFGGQKYNNKVLGQKKGIVISADDLNRYLNSSRARKTYGG